MIAALVVDVAPTYAKLIEPLESEQGNVPEVDGRRAVLVLLPFLKFPPMPLHQTLYRGFGWQLLRCDSVIPQHDASNLPADGLVCFNRALLAVYTVTVEAMFCERSPEIVRRQF